MKCRLHPKYKAVRKPKTCKTCWQIYNETQAVKQIGERA